MGRGSHQFRMVALRNFSLTILCGLSICVSFGETANHKKVENHLSTEMIVQVLCHATGGNASLKRKYAKSKPSRKALRDHAFGICLLDSMRNILHGGGSSKEAESVRDILEPVARQYSSRLENEHHYKQLISLMLAAASQHLVELILDWLEVPQGLQYLFQDEIMEMLNSIRVNEEDQVLIREAEILKANVLEILVSDIAYSPDHKDGFCPVRIRSALQASFMLTYKEDSERF